jgi:hypothetical protein
MERERLENLGVDGRIILRYSYIELEGVSWIIVAQDRVQWKAVANMLANFGICKIFGNSCTDTENGGRLIGVLSQHLFGGTKENFSQDSPCPS